MRMAKMLFVVGMIMFTAMLAFMPIPATAKGTVIVEPVPVPFPSPPPIVESEVHSETTSWNASDDSGRHAHYSVTRTWVSGVLVGIDSYLSTGGPGVKVWGSLPVSTLWNLARRFATSWSKTVSHQTYPGGGKG